jgi:hypothetical protein
MTRPELKPPRVVETRGVMEWSRNCDWVLQLPDVAAPRVTPRRLFVSIEETSALIELLECDVTSERDTCQPLESGDRNILSLTLDEARWMIAALQAALDEQDRRFPDDGEPDGGA